MLHPTKPGKSVNYPVIAKIRFTLNHDNGLRDDVGSGWDGPTGPKIGGSDLRVFRSSHRPKKGKVPR